MNTFSLVNKNTNRLFLVAGILTFACAIAYVVYTLFFDPGQKADFSVFGKYDVFRLAVLFFIMVILGFFNVWIEAFKWRYMTHKVEKVSVFTAMKSTFAGLAVGFVTPNRIGDFPGRAIVFSSSNIYAVMFMNLLAGYSQFIIICLLAGVSIWCVPVDFSLFFHSYDSFRGLYFAGFMVLFFFHVLVLFYPQKFLGMLCRVGFIRKIIEKKERLVAFDAKENIYVLGLSLLRSMAYTAQLVVLFVFFDRDTSVFQLVLYSNIYFFILTIAPSFMFNKFGIRESLAVIVFSDLVANPAIVVVSVLSLWIVNQVVPALLGMMVVIKKIRLS